MRSFPEAGPRPSLAGSPGLTFVEALAVAIIAAILAAVAIPIYTGYVTKQRCDVAEQLARTGAVAANVYWRRNNVAPAVADLDLFIADPDYTVTVADPNVTVTYDAGGDNECIESAAYR